jgi:hypothetical protein
MLMLQEARMMTQTNASKELSHQQKTILIKAEIIP